MNISGLKNGCSFLGVYLLAIEHGWENLPFLMDGLHMMDFHAFPASHVCRYMPKEAVHMVWMNFIVTKTYISNQKGGG